jgi:hypothetical protein
MMNTLKKSSGTIFVRYLTFGLISIFASIAIIKSNNNLFGGSSAITLGVIIFLINLITVLGYTYAVLSDENLMAETDAPDLAYYLGFSLTVGALSATFIVDTLIGQQATATEKSDLIKNSLLQFGIGLTATLIGLCGKIYLSSQQNFQQTEPEELLRTFRFQLKDCQSAIQESSKEFSDTLKTSTERLTESINNAMTSFVNLNETIISTNHSISTKLNNDNFTKLISDFTESTNKILSLSNKFSETNEKTINSLSEVTKFMNVLSTSASNVSSQLDLLEQRSQLLNTSSSDMNNVFKNLNESNKIMTENSSKVSSSLNDANNAIIKLGSSFVNSSDSFTKNFGDIPELQNFKNSLHRANSEIGKLESLINRINSMKI